MTRQLVTVIVINFNGQRYIRKCIEAIAQNSYKNIELIVVDNGSTDDERKELTKLCGDFKTYITNCFFLDRNYGPNFARNLAIRNSRGEFYLFVDHDAVISNNLIKNLVEFMNEHPEIWAAQSKLLRFSEPKIVDTCGCKLSLLGFVTEPCSGKPTLYCNHTVSRLGCRGVFIVRKAAFETLGLFDTRFFLGWDETEFFWRIWLSGHMVASCPSAIAFHVGSTRHRINFEGFGNGFIALATLLSIENLLPLCTLYLAGSLVWTMLLVKNGSLLRRAAVEWKRTGFRLGSIIPLRRKIQSLRKVNDKWIFRHILEVQGPYELLSKLRSQIGQVMRST